jgi:hypothetical protein
MSTTQIKGNQIQDGTITSADVNDSLEKDFTKARVSTGDSSPNFLASKVLAGDNITINVVGVSGSVQYLAISGSAGGGGGGSGSGAITGVTAGTGLSGGGASGNVTLSLSVTGSQGTYGSTSQIPVLAVNDRGVVTEVTNTSVQITESQVTNLVTDLSNKASTSTIFSAGAGLTGGGDLSTNRSFAINDSIVASVSGTQFTGPISSTGFTSTDRVLIISGSSKTVSQAGALIYDSTNQYLGIGTVPSRNIHVANGFRLGSAESYVEWVGVDSTITRITVGGTQTTLEMNQDTLFPPNKTIGFQSALAATKDSGFSRAAAGIINVSGSAPGAIFRFNAVSTPLAAGDLGMNTTTGRPNALIGGSVRELAHTAEIAPLTSNYIVTSADATLTNERVLTAGSGITITDGGAGSTITISATEGAGGSGADAAASYVVLSATGSLSNERVLTAGNGITITDGGANGSITVAGKFLGGSYVESGALGGQYGAVIPTVCPIDDTIPQLSEGQVILTTPSYTMKSATSKLKITAHVVGTCAAGYTYIVHTHRDSTANAEAVTRVSPPGNHYPTEVNLSYRVDSPGAGTAVVYKVVVGAQVSGQPISINGAAGSRNFGGKYLSTLSIEEFEQ